MAAVTNTTSAEASACVPPWRHGSDADLSLHHQLLRYEALFELLAGIRAQTTVEGMAALAGRRWKYLAPVVSWRLLLRHGAGHYLIECASGQTLVTQPVELGHADARLWREDRPRLLCGDERPSALHADASANVLALPVCSGGRVHALLCVASGQTPFTAMDHKFIRHVAGQLVDCLLLALQHAAELRQLQTQALTDALTGAANRAAILEQLDVQWRLSQRTGAPLAVLLVDVDHFKSVNDRFGHHAGDQLLRQLVQRFRSQVRGGECFGRVGGEEFVFVLANCDATRAQAVAQRLRQAVADSPFAIEDCTVTEVAATISVGVVSCSGPSCPAAERLLQAADEALYQAKAAGRNCVALAVPTHPSPAFQP